MADLKPIRVNNLEGGLSLKDPSILADNELAVATNAYYSNDKLLTVRKGQISFGQPIPDAVKVISLCDATTGWSLADDGANLTLEASAMKRGAGALKFDVDVSVSVNNDTAILNSTLTSVDITTTKGYVGFWLYVPAAFNTNLSSVTLRVGSSVGNYYEWTLGTLTEANWNFVVLPFSSATTTGTPVDTAIVYARLAIFYTAGYTDKVGVMLDDIVAYSSTYSKPMMSLKYFEESITPFTRHLIANCGTNVFSYDETTGYWNVIKTGITDGSRYAMAAYKNIQYYGNGVDNHASWNGKTWTEYTGANTYKGKYMLLANDIGYIAGDPSVPSTLAYTAATPSNLQTFPNVLVCDEDSSDGEITGLINLGPIVIVTKEKKIYKVNVATPSREQIDYSDGCLSGRSLTRVENEVFLMNQGGVYTLAQREATIGSIRADALTDDLQPLIDEITQKNITAGFYYAKNGNFYLFCDTNNDGVNETCLVFSLLTKKWTKYVGINANEAVIYTDSSGVEHFLIANALNGQCKEIEYGYNDNGNPISVEIATKDFNFDSPETYKTFEMLEIHGFIGGTSELKVRACVEGQDATGWVTIYGSDYAAASVDSGVGLGSASLGSEPLVGSGTSTDPATTLYPFKARIPMYQTGPDIQIEFENDALDSFWSILKISIYPVAQPIDIYPNEFIY